jgi:hypothetical protein
METLDLETLALLAALESDIELEEFDADDDLEEV